MSWKSKKKKRERAKKEKKKLSVWHGIRILLEFLLCQLISYLIELGMFIVFRGLESS